MAGLIKLLQHNNWKAKKHIPFINRDINMTKGEDIKFFRQILTFENINTAFSLRFHFATVAFI
jgi:hypothetical protein